MIFLEEHSRLLLVVHAVIGAALVAAATHLVVWTWGYWRGSTARHRGARKLAWIAASLFAAELLAGLLIYPTYKVRTRIEYLDNPTAIAVDYGNRASAREQVERRLDDSLRTAAVVAPDPRSRERMARWFDVKEHCVAVGFALAVGLALLLGAWTPKRDGTEIAPVVAGMALTSAATVWLAAIVGLLISSYRSIGS